MGQWGYEYITMNLREKHLHENTNKLVNSDKFQALIF